MANLEELRRGVPSKATKSYLIPVDDLTLETRVSLRANADYKLTENALSKKIREDDKDLILRDTLPNTDLGTASPGGVALAAQEDWLMAAAGVVAAEGPVVWATLANDRCVAFIGVGVETVPQPISRVRLQLGNGAIRGVYQIEQLNTAWQTRGYFSEVVIFSPLEQCAIRVMPRLAFAANNLRIPFIARTVEPIGAIVSAPSV